VDDRGGGGRGEGQGGRGARLIDVTERRDPSSLAAFSLLFMADKDLESKARFKDSPEFSFFSIPVESRRDLITAAIEENLRRV